jgi:hypothetical protein
MKTFSTFIAEARKMRILRTAHYTRGEAKNNIMSKGFQNSMSTGTYHPGDNKSTVYTTPSSRVGKDYGHSRVNLKIVNPQIKSTLSPKQYREKIKDLASKHEGEELQQKAKEISPIQQSRDAISQGTKIVRVPDAHHQGAGNIRGSYIMVNKDVANKSIDKNPQPTIRSNQPRRTKIRPKK